MLQYNIGCYRVFVSIFTSSYVDIAVGTMCNAEGRVSVN